VFVDDTRAIHSGLLSIFSSRLGKDEIIVLVALLAKMGVDDSGKVLGEAVRLTEGEIGIRTEGEPSMVRASPAVDRLVRVAEENDAAASRFADEEIKFARCEVLRGEGSVLRDEKEEMERT
jgi:hypothetical protein